MSVRTIAWSVSLHVAVIIGAMVAIPWPERARVAVPTAPIEGVIIDTAAIEREQKRQDDAARQVRLQQQRQQREERERVAAEEQKQLAAEREKQRAADAERERVAAAKREQDRRDQEKREQERAAQAQREKEAAAQRERERQAAEQRRREAELQAALSAESERAEAEAAGLLDRYISMIEARIRQNWDRPLSARPGIDCIVNVVQLPSGDVMSVQVAACNGDDQVRRSIEAAVRKASPLPKPPDPSLFERNLRVNFRPDE
jgi:colicin import membrane protein